MGMMRSILLLFIVAVAVAKATTSMRPSITICPGEPFDVNADVRILKTAIDSSNVTAIIDVLTKRSRPQRFKIANIYNMIYKVNLIDNLESKLTGNVKNLIVVLMTPTFDSLAKELHDAISRSPIDEGAIIEMFCILPESDITTAYNEKYGSLESDLKGSGSQPSLRRLLASRVATRLSRERSTDLELLTLDAQQLHNASVNQWIDTDESPLYSILVNRSVSDLWWTFRLYKNISGHDFEGTIEKDLPNDNKNKKDLLEFVKCINEPYLEYFADRLNASMAKDEMDERTLTRIIVTRSELDLNYIKNVFTQRNSSLNNLIAERITSDDDYKYALLSIITPSRMYCVTDVDK